MIENIFFDIGNVLLKFNLDAPIEIDTPIESLVKPVTDNVQLLEKLSKKYKIFAITDASLEQIEYEIKTFDFFEKFTDIIISEKCGFKKTDPEIYTFAAQKNSLIPNQCVFTDDRKENVEAAKIAGFYSIHFISNDNLVEKLKKLGIE